MLHILYRRPSRSIRLCQHCRSSALIQNFRPLQDCLRRETDVKPGRWGSLSLFMQTHLGEGHSEIKPPGPRSEVGSGPFPVDRKKSIDCRNYRYDCGFQAMGNMMRSSESLQLGWTSWSQARTQTQNRSNWHHRIKALCTSGREEGR